MKSIIMKSKLKIVLRYNTLRNDNFFQTDLYTAILLKKIKN